MNTNDVLKDKSKAFVYDYETVSNCFIAVFIDIKNTSNIISFEISDYKNDFLNYYLFIEDCLSKQTLLVSYNGLKFDNQITRHLHSNFKSFSKLKGSDLAKNIYATSQLVIARSNEREFPMYSNKTNEFRECDILAINNYDNPAKRCSLKWLQYSMDWYNVEDMGKSHTKEHDEEDIKMLLNYCINDCLSTRNLFFKNKAEILLRQKLSKHFKLDLFNHSEPKLAKSIFLKLLSEKLNIKEYDLSKKQSFRKVIDLNEAILPYIKFTTPNLQNTLTKFKSLKLNGENLKGSFAHKTTYKGLELSFALGGIHGAKKGIYESDKNFIIKSFDVTSFYPNLSIRNNWAPGHIDKDSFCEIYESFFEERKKYSKKDPLNYVYKILLNSTYGLSNEANSFLKDSLFTMKITCNGQLLLVMLIEELCETIPAARPIMVNTDGGEIIIPREHEDLYHEICKKWEALTKLDLEFESYEKLIIPDVNNYIGIFSGKEITKEEAVLKIKTEFPKPLIKRNKNNQYFLYNVKAKGRFEIDKPLHKNKSFRIKRIAYYNYFIHGIKPEITINENQNILDYCGGVRAKGDWKFVGSYIKDGIAVDEKLPKTLRYYVSTSGYKLRKLKEVWGLLTKSLVPTLFPDEPISNETILLETKAIKIEADNCLEQLNNKLDVKKQFSEYKVDISYYLKKIKKEIQNIIPNN
jgi:hypothetical protein